MPNDDFPRKTLIVVFGQGELISRLCSFLETKSFSVYCFDPLKTALPVLLSPDYLVYFLPGSYWDQSIKLLSETYLAALHGPRTKKCRLIILGQKLSLDRQKEVDNYLIGDQISGTKINLVPSAELKGDDFLENLYKVILSLEQNKWTDLLSPPLSVNKNDVEAMTQTRKLQTKRRSLHLPWLKVANALILFVAFFLLLTISSVLIPLFKGGLDLKYVKDNFSNLTPTLVKSRLVSAQANFEISRYNLGLLSPAFSVLGQRAKLVDLDNLIALGKGVATIGLETLDIALPLQTLFAGITDPNTPTYSFSAIYSLRPKLGRLSQDLAWLEATLRNTPQEWKSLALGKDQNDLETGLSSGKLLLEGATSLLSSLGSIIGEKSPKKYLIVLQNPAELRPTGGFIGSFAILTLDQGKLVGFRFHDIYDADGQMTAKIDPPDEILHFLGQPNWYMRDANWSPDFPVTAKRLIWFLEKETGERVDGVIAIDVHAMRKLLRAIGPVEIVDFAQSVDADNLFDKAEFHSEINFFPGSTQKRDFLAGVAEAALARLSSGSVNNPAAVAEAFASSLREKNLLFYSREPVVQSIFERNDWAGSVIPSFCKLPTLPICMLIVDANLGANKANYYLQRNFELRGGIGKAGDVELVIKVNYENRSPSKTWPGGDYKNYLRFFLPMDSIRLKVELDDDRVATFSSVLTANVLSSLNHDQFLVRQASESGYLVLGTLVNVPVGSRKTVTLTGFLPERVDFKQDNPEFNLVFLKQPGTTSEPVDFTLEYPSFLSYQPRAGSLLPNLVAVQKLVYNTQLDQDKKFEARFLVKP